MLTFLGRIKVCSDLEKSSLSSNFGSYFSLPAFISSVLWNLALFRFRFLASDASKFLKYVCLDQFYNIFCFKSTVISQSDFLLSYQNIVNQFLSLCDTNHSEVEFNYIFIYLQLLFDWKNAPPS